MLCVCGSLGVTRLHEIDVDAYDSLDIELINKMTKIIVGVVYRPTMRRQ